MKGSAKVPVTAVRRGDRSVTGLGAKLACLDVSLTEQLRDRGQANWLRAHGCGRNATELSDYLRIPCLFNGCLNGSQTSGK